MFSSLRTPVLRAASASRGLSTSSLTTKVAILGAGGGIGQPLSLLLKLNSEITNLALYDIRGAPGVAADVGHVDFHSKVAGYAADKLDNALEGSKIIIIPAGVPRKPGMTRDDLFNTNASIVRDLAIAIARTAPDAHILVISNPVNSTVPIVASTLEKHGVFDPKKLFGVTTLDVVRAAKFLSQVTGGEPKDSRVTVVGGHSGNTIVPLLSQTKAAEGLDKDAYEALVKRIQFGGDEVVKAKDGAGSATLSMAYAGATFANTLIRALNGEKGIIVPTFVKSPLYVDQGVDFFASGIELGTGGVEKIHPVGKISAREEELLNAALPELKTNIEKGRAFVA